MSYCYFETGCVKNSSIYSSHWKEISFAIRVASDRITRQVWYDTYR